MSGITKTVWEERPVLPMGTGTHFSVIEGGEKKPVENEDYAAMLIRFGDEAVGAGALGTLEASRVAVGPRARYEVEIYGTEGSMSWDFERLNELQLALGYHGEHVGYQRIMANPHFGDFGNYQPGAGPTMGYDDLKTIEARKFLEAFLGIRHDNSNIHDAVSAARVVQAAEDSAETKAWISIDQPAGTTHQFKGAP